MPCKPHRPRPALLLVALGTATALAHAFLERAEPAIDSTVPTAPSEVVAFLHAKSRAGFQLGAGDRREWSEGRSGQGAGQRQHHAGRPESAVARNLQGSMARAFRRYAHDAGKFLFPRRPLARARKSQGRTTFGRRVDLRARHPFRRNHVGGRRHVFCRLRRRARVSSNPAMGRRSAPPSVRSSDGSPGSACWRRCCQAARGLCWWRSR